MEDTIKRYREDERYTIRVRREVGGQVRMNKFIRELMRFSLFVFTILGILLIGNLAGINKWIISTFAVLYLYFVLRHFKLETRED